MAGEQNATVFGTNYTAREITDYDAVCDWSFGSSQFYSVKMSHPAAQTFYNSLYKQYAEWGVDFIKNDCVFGDFVLDQIRATSTAIEESGRMMLYSLSPGMANLTAAKEVTPITNMYRITGDTWVGSIPLFISFKFR